MDTFWSREILTEISGFVRILRNAQNESEF
jgi:hypothetical protein